MEGSIIMRLLKILIFSITLALAPLHPLAAQTGPMNGDLLSGCAQVSLKSCRMSTRVVSFEKLSTYEKAFNCMKYGSNTGDSFGLNLPIPDFGVLGFNIGSSAKYSKKVCVEEIQRLDNARFFKDFSDTFDQECGRALAGQYRQCVEAATRIGSSGQIQSLSCSLAQNRDRVIINTRYVPGAMEGPEQYRIASVKGIEGIDCERDTYAGVNQYSSFICALPQNHEGGALNVRLGNGVTCSVEAGRPIALEIERQRKYSCTALFNREVDSRDGRPPMILQATLSGLCDICLDRNLNTGATDQRSLANRLKSCAVWSVYAHARGDAQFCKVAAITPPGPGGFIPYGGMGVMGMPSRPGTVREIYGGFSPTSGSPYEAHANPCADIPPGWAISLKGGDWENIPIDFLRRDVDVDLSPELQAIIPMIEAYFPGD